MKVLSLGTDKSILNPDSSLARRVLEYGNLVDKYWVIVPADKNLEIKLSDKVVAYGIKSSNKFLALFKIKKLASQILKQEKFDVLTVQDPYYLALLGLKLAKKFNLGLEIQVHGFEKLSGIRQMIARYILPRANSVRVVSQRLKNKLITAFGVDESKIIVVPIYVPVSSLMQKQSSGKFIFLTIGRLVPVKNIGLQIRAFKNIFKNNQNIELWIVGTGPLEAELKRLADNSSIRFFAKQVDVKEFYSQADVFMLTSTAEGWGLVVVEAAAFSLPIIMTDVGLAGEFIKDGISGLIIPINDQMALEKAMLKLLTDQNLRKKLGDNACQATKTLPNQKQILDLYKQAWLLAYERHHTTTNL